MRGDGRGLGNEHPGDAPDQQRRQDRHRRRFVQQLDRVRIGPQLPRAELDSQSGVHQPDKEGTRKHPSHICLLIK